MSFGSENIILNSLLPLDFRSEFVTLYWDKKHAIWESDLYLKCNMDAKSLHSIIQSIELVYPEVSCLSQSGVLNPQEYIIPGQSSAIIDPQKLLEKLNAGFTIRLKEFYRYYTPWQPFRTILTELFQCPVSLNLYLNQKAEGIKPHFDVHHIFIIQLEGKKTWEIGPMNKERPRYDFAPGAATPPENEKFNIKLELVPGNILYLPIGLWHKTTTEERSLHLAIGLMTPDWVQVLKGYIQYVSDNCPDFKKQLNSKHYSNRNNHYNLPVFHNILLIQQAIDSLKGYLTYFGADELKKYVLHEQNF